MVSVVPEIVVPRGRGWIPRAACGVGDDENVAVGVPMVVAFVEIDPFVENAPGEIDRTPAGPVPVAALAGKGWPCPGPPGAPAIPIICGWIIRWFGTCQISFNHENSRQKSLKQLLPDGTDCQTASAAESVADGDC